MYMWDTIIDDGRFMVSLNFRDIDRGIDASFGGIDIPPIENGEYLKFFQDVNTAVNVGALIVSIFMDASGQTFAKDSNGNDINLRLVVTTSYTYPYFDSGGTWHEGTFFFTFDDGSSFNNVDTNNSTYWYYIQGVSDMNNLLQWT